MASLVNQEFWKNKRVFLTGHTGFIGGWLTLWLHRLGAEVYGYSLAPNTNPSFFQVADIGRLCHHHVGDIRHFADLQKHMQMAKPDIVLHLAAQALVRPAYKDPLETYNTNVMGTAHVLEAARHSSQAVIVFTTDKVYENLEEDRGFVESDRLGGFEPYGVSKACAELIAKSYWHSYYQKEKIGLATVRAGNVIGGGDWSVDRLIPDAVRAFSKNKTLEIRQPGAIRPWQHVLEPCQAILLLAEKIFTDRAELRALNIGPEESDAKNVGWISDELTKRWDNARWTHVPSDGIYEAKLLMLNNSLAKKYLDWQPAWTIDKALDYTVAWYLEQLKGGNMQSYCANQLAQFTKDATHG